VSRAHDRALLARARSGDADTWEALYRGVYPRLFAYARRRLATEEQAEEAVSETMVRAMGKIGDYRPGTSGIDGWLFGIARFVVFEHYRAGGRVTPMDPAMITDLHPATAPDPGDLVIAQERQGLLRAAFGRLSRDDQDLLEQRVLLGLDAAQVGALTNRRAGAVRTAQSRALQRLRVEYEGLMA